ncbi:hypothetical protein ACWGJ2_40465 [Streptomyces sp. NPDC054796]
MHTIAIALAALAAVQVPAYFNEKEGMLVAHPADVPRDQALSGEHVLVSPREYRTGRGYSAVARVPDGGVDFTLIAFVFWATGDDVNQCARAVAEWVTTPRPTAGAVLRAALAEWGITMGTDYVDGTNAIPQNAATSTTDIRGRAHLTVGAGDFFAEHVPASHTGWIVGIHDEIGEHVGTMYFPAKPEGDLVDCAADSSAVAEAIADYLTRPPH